MPPALTAAQIAETGAFLARMQGADGALPWFPGGQWDAWNHTEALMGLTVSGVVVDATDEVEGERLLAAARAGLDHLAHTQRPDGSWPMEVRDGAVVHAESDTNQCAYPAVGVWHYVLATGDDEVDARYWPMVRDAINHVLTAQRDDGTIAWAINERGGLGDHALLTGNASILQSLWAACALARRLGHEPGEWHEAARRLAEAVRRAPEAFADRDRFSMDWFYPVLGGALTGDAAWARLEADWARFVWVGKGVRCVDDRPWVTGGEGAELVMALCCLDGTRHEARAREQARRVLAEIQRLRDGNGAYWTGCVVDDDAIWPEERTGWTAGAVLLAADALDGLTPAANFFHAMTWPATGDAASAPSTDSALPRSMQETR
ncbi:glucosidase family protein [Dermacoccus barathri]|uniref:prenyltransferase n=1 Tax=Dermacoccus barathri TaxID=322601 RepID=UPI00187A5C4E|nr:prenyltransferase [Dermacoccus barathri]MBE7372326.1 prenyltransferase [Dermacoccus barathri]